MQDERGLYEVVFDSSRGLETNLGHETEEKRYGNLRIRAAAKKKKPKEYVHRKEGSRCINYVHVMGGPSCLKKGKKKKPHAPKKKPTKKK